MKNVVVLGSTNVDTILNVDHFPLPGETMKMSDMAQAGGGKGANQALAATRLGADVSFISRVGDDGTADFMLDTFKKDGMNTENIYHSKTSGTGQAFIMVNDEGQNSIMIYGGANNEVGAEDIKNAESSIKNADILISQFEVPMDSIVAAFKLAKDNNVMTILNPAPATKDIPNELMEMSDIIVPNETESELLTGIKVTDRESMDKASKKMIEMGVKTVIITVGSMGSYYNTGDKIGFINAFKVKAIDTTAAGDTFIGAFSTKISNDLSNIEEAMIFANKASSIAVQTSGAQVSIPYKKDVII